MVRKNRRERIDGTYFNLHLRTEIIKRGTLKLLPIETRFAFLENTVLLLAGALERRKRKGKS